MVASSATGTGHGSAEGPVRGLGPVHKIFKQTENTPAFTLDDDNALKIRSDIFPSGGTEGEVLQIDETGQPSWDTLHGNDITLNFEEPENAITLTVEDNVVLCDVSSSPFVVTLPLAADMAGKVFHIKKIDASNNAVSVTGSEDDDSLIDGGVFATIGDQWECITITTNGAHWYVL